MATIVNGNVQGTGSIVPGGTAPLGQNVAAGGNTGYTTTASAYTVPKTPDAPAVLHNGDGTVYTPLPSTTSPTGKDVFGNPVQLSGSAASATPASLSGGISASDLALENNRDTAGKIAGTAVDEASIRDNVLRQMQAEIDATNKIYSEKLRQSQISGQGRLGTQTSVNARRGLLGSDFGNAAADNVVADNNSVYAGIDAEKNAAIASLTDKGAARIRQELADKNAVKQQNSQDYIQYLTQAENRRTARTNDAATAAIGGSFDLSTATPDQIKQIADQYHISPDALKAAYITQKNSIEKARLANEQAQADLTKPTGIPAASAAYQYDPATGKSVQIAAANPTDSVLKEYQYAVANDGETRSLNEWKISHANDKVSIAASRSPIDGSLQTYTKTGPSLVGGTKGYLAPVQAGPAKNAVVSNSPAIPSKGLVADPLSKLSGSDLAYAQTGNPNAAKLKFPGQIDAAEKRIKAIMPDWNPGTAVAQAAFFRSPKTQTFIANSNTVLSTINDPVTGIKALSDKVDRTNIQFVNGTWSSIRAVSSNSPTAIFLQTANIMSDEASKILGSGQGSDFTIQLASQLTNANYSKQTFNDTMNNLDARIRNKVAEYYKQAGQTNYNTAGVSGGTTALTGPDGVSYNVPNDKVDAFKAAGGH